MLTWSRLRRLNLVRASRPCTRGFTIGIANASLSATLVPCQLPYHFTFSCWELFFMFMSLCRNLIRTFMSMLQLVRTSRFSRWVLLMARYDSHFVAVIGLALHFPLSDLIVGNEQAASSLSLQGHVWCPSRRPCVVRALLIRDYFLRFFSELIAPCRSADGRRLLSASTDGKVAYATFKEEEYPTPLTKAFASLYLFSHSF